MPSRQAAAQEGPAGIGTVYGDRLAGQPSRILTLFGRMDSNRSTAPPAPGNSRPPVPIADARGRFRPVFKIPNFAEAYARLIGVSSIENRQIEPTPGANAAAGGPTFSAGVGALDPANGIDADVPPPIPHARPTGRTMFGKPRAYEYRRTEQTARRTQTGAGGRR